MQNFSDQSLSVTVLSKARRHDPWNIHHFISELYARAYVENIWVGQQFVVMIDANGKVIDPKS